jgi:hypothetical protein
MRRVLYTVILVAMLAIPAGNAFAAPPPSQVIQDGWWILGEIWWTPDYMATTPKWAPFERVDAYMTRPSTLAGWPLNQAPIMGTWWWTGPASKERRMSYAEDYLYANQWGGYYAQFMLPRDEVWFPCSYPLKWKCNYQTAPGVWQYHSPAAMAYECRWINAVYFECLDWPWAVAPYDTISPVVIDIYDPGFPAGWSYEFELEIAGYFWKFSDFE